MRERERGSCSNSGGDGGGRRIFEQNANCLEGVCDSGWWYVKICIQEKHSDNSSNSSTTTTGTKDNACSLEGILTTLLYLQHIIEQRKEKTNT